MSSVFDLKVPLAMIYFSNPRLVHYLECHRQARTAQLSRLKDIYVITRCVKADLLFEKATETVTRGNMTFTGDSAAPKLVVVKHSTATTNCRLT